MAAKPNERLLDLLQQLPEEQAQQLLDYAEFLLERYGQPETIPAPRAIPRPPEETVIQAIRRLAASYPMLDRRVLFSETTTLMTEHLMQGRDAVEVIDQLELVFRRHYESLADSLKPT